MNAAAAAAATNFYPKFLAKKVTEQSFGEIQSPQVSLRIKVYS